MVYQCLIDKKRVQAFKRAIFHSVKPGDIVVDLGTGSGILSLFAAKAGAKKIYAVEADTMIYQVFKNHLKDSIYKDQIILMNNYAEKVQLPEKVDIVICEMIATGLIDELQVPVMNHIHKFCKKTTKIILKEILNFIEVVEVRNRFYGENLQTIQYEYSWHKKNMSIPLSEKHLYKKIDFTKLNDHHISVSLDIPIKKNGVLNGIRISNRTIFSDSSILDETDAYCMPLTLPTKTLKVLKGDIIRLKLNYELCKGMQNFIFSLSRL